MPDQGLVEMVASFIQNGWLFSALELIAIIYLAKRLMAKSDAVEAERDRLRDILIARNQEGQ